MEQMQYNLLFRWFVGLGINDPVWVPTVFTKSRDRLLTADMSRKVMAAILAHREGAPPGDDGPDDLPKTSIAPAAQPIRPETETDQTPRFNRRSRNPEVNFKGEKRSNTTHASLTDPDARLYKKSPGTGWLCKAT